MFWLPKLEWDRRAILGWIRKRLTAAAARMVVSAICSAVGSGLTWVSQRKMVPRRKIRALSAEALLTPGCRPRMSMAFLRWVAALPTAPANMASASLRSSIRAAITVVSVRTTVRAAEGETPRRSITL